MRAPQGSLGVAPTVPLRGPARLLRNALRALIGDADAMPVHHLPALPAGEEQSADGDQRQDESLRDNCRGAFAVAGVPVIELDQDDDHVAAGMPPGVVEAADAFFT